MPLAIDTVAGSVASGTVASVAIAFTPGVGDTFQVRNFAASSYAKLDMLSASYNTANVLRVRSPMLHDNVQALRFRIPSADASNELCTDALQSLVAQDTLTLELFTATAPGVTETETVAMGIYYADLPGGSARLHMPADITPIIRQFVTVEVPVVVNGTAGNWASAAINSLYDLLQANTDYAVVGYELDTAATAVAVRGADTSNFRVGAPGITDRYKTRQHFFDHSMWTGMPHVPVINSANKSATFVDVVSRAVAGTVNVTLILAELQHNL